MNLSARPRPPQHWSGCRRQSARAYVRCPPSLVFQIERQARGYARDAFERRVVIEIVDASAEKLNLGWREHALKTGFHIEDVVGGLAIIALKQFPEPDQRLFDGRGIARGSGSAIAGALVGKRLGDARKHGIEGE